MKVLWYIWSCHVSWQIHETHSFQLALPGYHWKNVNHPVKFHDYRSAIFSSNSQTISVDSKKSEMKNAMEQETEDLSRFQSCLEQMLLPKSKQDEILLHLQNKGFTSSSELYAIAIDFQDKPRVLSEILMEDFGFDVAKSHVVRGALLRLVQAMQQETVNIIHSVGSNPNHTIHTTTTNTDTTDTATVNTNDDDITELADGTTSSLSPSSSSLTMANNNNDKKHYMEQKRKNTTTPTDTITTTDITATKTSSQEKKQPLFKSVIVNPKAKKRHTAAHQEHTYGLPNNYRDTFPTLSQELDQFESFMIMPTAASTQESPIRNATASVYMRHAKLFLGWYHNVYTANNRQYDSKESSNHPTPNIVQVLSIKDIFPNKDATTAQCIIDFILWLRKTRDISHSYEANMLRGLTKLLKFRFHKESQSDPSYGEKSFNDIPVVRELRKLHRDANRRQNISPRSSEEDRKWLDWNEYLSVVQRLKMDVEDEIHVYSQKKTTSKSDRTSRRRIATKFQAYLILAFFSCVPDRQRTFRELEVGRSFLRDDKINCWIIKHGPDDYKTGKTYGDRPPLVLTPELSPAIDDFFERWRPSLDPTGDHFFVQPRTGKSLTQDSVYSIVARSCFKYTGKKTNPHLLRDMIVTHVRNTDASEKELEALALYMGHSISMQRNSYDRRTMEQKVAPAVELLRNVNSI